jgi:hypothetical protein
MIDRETAWLAFSARVLQEAADPTVPLFERLFFCGIFSSNLDEYFRVRVASLRSLLRLGKGDKAKLGIDPHRLLHDIHRIVLAQQERYGGILGGLIDEMAREGIVRVDDETVDPAHDEFLRQTFRETVAHLIKPAPLKGEHGPPFLENNEVYLVVELWDRERETRDSWTPSYHLIDVPARETPRFVTLPTRGDRHEVMFLDDLIRYNLDQVFPDHEVGTVFEGQDKLKLVTPCNDGNDNYQNYVFDEFMAYRVLNALTPYSFRVRLVEITYEDVNDEYDTRTKYGFLIEDEEVMAERSRATFQDIAQFHPSSTSGDYSVLVAMFNYMIANTDWSPVYFHNVKLIRSEDARFLTVPYDFDMTGTVNPRYAIVDESLPIRSIRRRLFRGFCRDELTHDAAVQRFRETRDEVTALFNDFAALGFEQFDEDDAEDALDYFEDFYKVVDDPDEFEDEILDDCRSWD